MAIGPSFHSLSLTSALQTVGVCVNLIADEVLANRTLQLFQSTDKQLHLAQYIRLI
jgi:hypothetical protein